MSHENAQPGRRWPIVVAIGLLVATALLVIALLLVHTPPLRAFALRYASRVVLNLGVRLEAERLDYNLLTLRVGLVGVKVWAVGEEQPFFEADEVRAAFPARVLRGTVSVDEVTIQQGVVHILRRADGSTNLPRSTQSSTGDPAPLPITRVSAPRLTIDYRDEGNEFVVRVPAFSLDLSERGRVALDAPAEVVLGSNGTTIGVFQADAAFDGRDLRLSEMRIEAPEARTRLEGTLAIFRREPAMDLRVTGEADLARASKWWGQSGQPPRGAVRFEGMVRGPFARLAADLNLISDGLAAGSMETGSVAARIHLDEDAIEVAELQLQLVGGQVTATGGLAWQSQQARVNASWRDVDAARLVAILSAASIVPSGRSSGEIAASGPANALDAWDVDARLNVDRGPSLRGRIPVPGEARFRLADHQWRLEAKHLVGGAAAVDVSLTGLARGPSVTDSTLMGSIRASQSDVKELLRVLSESGVASVSGDLVSGSIRAQAEVEGTVGRPVVTVMADSDAATVAGYDVVNLRARGRLAGSTFELEELFAQQPSTSTDGDPRGHIQAAGGYDLRRGSYAGRVSAGSWRFTPTPDLPLSAVVGLEYAGEGRGRLAYGKGRVSANRAAWEGVDLGEVAADFELAGDVAHVTASTPDFGAVADASVGLASPYAATVRANAPALDLARVVRDAKLPTAVSGSVNVRVDAEGPLERWRDGRASVDIASLDARVGDLPVRLSESARVRYEGQRLLVDRLEASAGGTRLSASGALAVPADGRPGATPADSLVVTLTGDVGDVNEVARAVGAAAGYPDPFIAGGDGPVSVLARISGTVAAPLWAADLEVGPSTLLVRADLPSLVDLRVRAHVENGLLELREATGAYQDAHFIARGQAPLALLGGSPPGSVSGDALVQARATGITAAVLSPFVDASTLTQIAGSLDATLNLTAPALNIDAVSGELILERLDLAIADVPIRQRLPTRVAARDGFARVEEWEWEGEGTSLNVEGQVRLRDQQAALLLTGAMDARLLTAFLRDSGITTAGRVEPRLSVSGPLAEPTVNGDIHLAGGEVRIREPRIVVADLDARAVLARGQAYLTTLTGTVNGGMLTGSGQLDYAPRLQGRFTVEAAGMAIEFPEGLRSEVDASIELTMASAADRAVPSGRLSGTVTVNRGAYREPLALVAGVLANLRRSTTTTASAERSPLLEQLVLDVRVITDEDLVIQNNVARAQLGADLRVIGSAAAPSLSGRAELREGDQLFLGRNRYTVESGTIDFANPVMIEPILGIVANTRVSSVDIQIRLTGPPEALMTELSSSTDPELGQADLTSLLLTGQPLDKLSTQEASVVGAQVLGNLSGDVLGFAGRTVGLDTLRVGGVDTTTALRDPADLASEVDPTSRLTFGKSLGSNLDVTLSQSLRESGDQTWIIDYLPVRRIALRFVTNDDDLRSYEFRHDLTFGGPPRAIKSGDVSRNLEPPRVVAVHLSGQPGFREQQLRQQLRLREGDRFDFIAWQEDRDRLERFYHDQRHFAAHIAVSRRDTAEGVELNYELTAGPETAVRVNGAQLSRATIESIETAWSQSVFDGFLLEEVEGIVRGELARDGVYQPMVTVTFVDSDTTHTLDITVVPGTRAERVDVRLDGVADPLRSDLAQAVGDRASGQLAITDPIAYERRLVDDLRVRGYIRRQRRSGPSVGRCNGLGSRGREFGTAVPHRARHL
jgi:autotransporter translocation and assembly factor TamB